MNNKIIFFKSTDHIAWIEVIDEILSDNSDGRLSRIMGDAPIIYVFTNEYCFVKDGDSDCVHRGMHGKTNLFGTEMTIVVYGYE